MKKKRKYRSNEYPAHFSHINYNSVCFSCRYTTRVRNWTLCDMKLTCPFCKKNLINLGCKTKIPKKTDDKAWNKLKELYG